MKHLLLASIFLTLTLSACDLLIWEKDEPTFKDPYSSNPGIEFDGTTDRISVNPENIILPKEKQFTLEAMIKADPQQTTYPQIVSTRNSAGFYDNTLFGLWDNGLPFSYFGHQRGGNVCYRPAADTIPGEYNPPSQSFDLRDNTWHHIAYTSDGKRFDIYIDGILTCAINSGRFPDFSQAFIIGGDLGSPHNTNFHGRIKELRLWNVALKAPSDFIGKTILGNETDLIGYWPLNPNSAKPLEDKSSIPKHGEWIE